MTSPKATLYNADCLSILPTLEAGSIKTIVLSPPYNIGKSYNSYQDSRDDYLQWCDAWLAQLRRVLAPDGHFFLNMGSKPTQPWTPYQVLEVAGKHFCLQNQIIWVKAISLDLPDGTQSYGHYKPINSKKYLNDTWEFVWHFTSLAPGQEAMLDRLAIGVPFQDKSNMVRGRGKGDDGVIRDLRCRGNVWFVPYTTVHGAKTHPAAFPERLVELCVAVAGSRGPVLDPFLGGGTVTSVATRLGLDSIGMEVDASYHALAVERTRSALRTAGGAG